MFNSTARVGYLGKCEEVYTFRPDGIMTTCSFSSNHPWYGELHTYAYNTSDIENYLTETSPRPAPTGVYVRYMEHHPKFGVCRYYYGKRSDNELMHVELDIEHNSESAR